MSDSPPPVNSTDLTKHQTLLIFIGMLMATFLASLDGTAVSTALPTIAGELGGIDQLPWVLTAYLLGSVAATPLYGKLSDLYGRRALTEVALVVFVATSLMAATSQSMLQLVVSRGLQGIGGGGLMAMGFIVIGDIFSPRERGRYMAYYTMNFTFSALVGPVIGGVFVDVASWRWIFLVNIPLGLAAWLMIHRNLTFTLPPREHSLDIVGSTVLVAGVTALVLGLAWGGETYPWASIQVVGLLVGAVVASVAFVLWELRAREPVLPMRLFRNPTFRILIGGNIVYGSAGMAAVAFMPLFFQVSLGETATRAGLILASMSIAVTAGSYIAGRVTTGTGRYRWLLRTAPILTLVSLLAYTTLDEHSSAVAVIPWLGLAGLSMGTAFPTMTTATQNSLELPDLGAGTAAINFFRTLGQTVGVGAYGALLTARIKGELDDLAGSIDVDELLSTPDEIQSLEPQLREAVEHAVAVASNSIFWAAVPIMAAACVAMWFLPELELRTTTALAAQSD
ncbi:MAG: MFS transporter [Actinomycetia bacterium]|nr:MFS transporter [Actinomycetes bacterium]